MIDPRRLPADIQKILGVGVVVFGLILFWMGQHMYKNSMSQVADYRKQRQRVILENEIGKKLENLNKMRDSVVSVRESSRFLAEIAKMTGQMGIGMKSIAALPMQRHREYIKLGLELEIVCTYNELGNFIARIESPGSFVHVTELDCAKKDAQHEEMTSKITLNTIYFVETLLEK